MVSRRSRVPTRQLVPGNTFLTSDLFSGDRDKHSNLEGHVEGISGQTHGLFYLGRGIGSANYQLCEVDFIFSFLHYILVF